MAVKNLPKNTYIFDAFFQPYMDGKFYKKIIHCACGDGCYGSKAKQSHSVLSLCIFLVPDIYVVGGAQHT